jgi:hypothetical protein
MLRVSLSTKTDSGATRDPCLPLDIIDEADLASAVALCYGTVTAQSVGSADVADSVTSSRIKS